MDDEYRLFLKNFSTNNIDTLKNDINIIKCSFCKELSDENDVVEKDGYYICLVCGITISPRIFDGAEWNNYVDSSGNLSNNSRCGGNHKTTDLNPFTESLVGSFIPKGVNNVCFENGKMCKYDISKVHMKNNYNHLHKSFNLVEDQLDQIASDKYCKRVISTAKILWGEIMNFKTEDDNGEFTRKITRAGVRKGLIACCLYYSCIHYDSTRSPLEICRDFGMKDTKQFNKGDREFKEMFENIPRWSHLLSKTSSTKDYFLRFCSELEMNRELKEGQCFEITKQCIGIYEDIKHEIQSTFPKNSACGIIYYVLKLNKIHITKTKLSKILGICGPSLTKCGNAIVELVEKTSPFSPCSS